MSRSPAIVHRVSGDDGAAFAISGGKWSVLVVARLGESKKRFNELRRELSGVSQKTLTSTLRALERDGFVLRTMFATVPMRVEYELTEPGFELLQLATAFADFSQRHRDYVEQARRQFDTAAGAEDDEIHMLIARR